MAGTPGRENHHQAYASAVSRDNKISELECNVQIIKSLWDTEWQLFLKGCENCIFKFWNLGSRVSGLRLAARLSPDVSKSPSRMSRSRRTAWHRLQPPTRDPTQCCTTTCFPHHRWRLLRGLALLLRDSDLPVRAFITSVTREVSSCPSLHISSWKDEVWEKTWKPSRDSRTEWSWNKMSFRFFHYKNDIQHMGRT